MFLSLEPFHDNYSTPSAKIYHDKKGDTLWCFTEQKRYYPSDVLKKGFIKGKSVESIYVSLWRKLPESTKEILIDNYGAPISYISEMWVNNKSTLELFKQGQISIEQHISLIRQCIE